MPGLEQLADALRGKKKEKRSFGGRLKSAFLGSRGSRKKNLRKEEERRGTGTPCSLAMTFSSCSSFMFVRSFKILISSFVSE